MATAVISRPRTRVTAPSPARWQSALKRALAEGVQVRQVNDSGLWIATSGTQDGVAYTLTVVNGVALDCSCPAGMHDDRVCKHRAAYWHLMGILELDEPEPDPPASIAPVPAAPVPSLRLVAAAHQTPDALAQPAAVLSMARVTCGGCGRTGVAITGRVPADPRCHACRTSAPRLAA